MAAGLAGEGVVTGGFFISTGVGARCSNLGLGDILCGAVCGAPADWRTCSLKVFLRSLFWSVSVGSTEGAVVCFAANVARSTSLLLFGSLIIIPLLLGLA